MAIFDEDAPVYDQWFAMKLGKYADEVETDILFNLLAPYKGMNVLDVGCGTGNMAIKLAGMGCQVTGIDVSREMLKRAEEKTLEAGLSIKYIHGDIKEMDYENVFDGICSNTAFEFFTEKEKSLDKMLDAVKPGGRVVVGTINKDSDWYDYYEEEISKDNSFFHIFKYASFISEEEMKDMRKENFIDMKKGLYLPPDIPESLIKKEIDQMFKIDGKRGGYICGLWIK